MKDGLLWNRVKGRKDQPQPPSLPPGLKPQESGKVRAEIMITLLSSSLLLKKAYDRVVLVNTKLAHWMDAQVQTVGRNAA